MNTAAATTVHTLLVDDHALFRESITGAFHDPGFVLEHCASIREALQLMANQRFDLVLLDQDLGAERASHFLPAAREAGFDGKVLVVTAWISENEARRLLRQGVSGIFLKRAPLEELKNAMRVVLEGGVFVDPSFSFNREVESSTDSHSPTFSDRQRRVLRFVVEGLSNKEIAWRLQISESYVKAILQSLFQKTGVRTRGQLVRVAFEQYEDQLQDR